MRRQMLTEPRLQFSGPQFYASLTSSCTNRPLCFRLLDSFHTVCISHAAYTTIVLDFQNILDAIKFVWSMNVSEGYGAEEQTLLTLLLDSDAY